MNYEMYCLICDKKLKPSLPIEGFRPQDVAPGDALVCYSIGNYGSTLYDPFKEAEVQKLEFYICDPCAKKKEDKIYTVFGYKDKEFEFKPGIHND